MKNRENVKTDHTNTVIIGGGQAGLATAYFLKKAGIDFIILEAHERVGDSWRVRWDTLRLFTPVKYDSLPGSPFPGPAMSLPGRDEVASYLESYAHTFDLPIRHGIEVKRLTKTDGGFEIISNDGLIMCDRVVVATGPNPKPRIPEFAADIDPSVYQIHSSEYRNPESLPDGEVLVVGAGTSGIEIAIEVGKTHPTVISGKPTFHIPNAIFRFAGGFYWWFIKNVVTVRTPLGRKAKQQVTSHGGPLIGISAGDLTAAGIRNISRLKGAQDGFPVTEDDEHVKASIIIWCTGFKPDFSWISAEITDQFGWPLNDRGVSPVKGLYFVGMLFQYGLTSGLMGGVGRDAAYIVDHIRKNA